MPKYILKKFNSGLTLIETLVAISILLMAVVGPMTIYSNSISSARYSGNKTIAYYLAQEGIELVKYKINTEFNSGSGWFSSLPDCIAGNCTVSVSNDTVCVGCDTKLYIGANNLYTHTSSGATPTNFSRTVKFAGSPPESGALVSSTVTWVTPGGNKSVTVEEYMTKWR